MRSARTTMTTVKAPTFAASVNRLMVALWTILAVGLAACAETARTPSEPGSFSRGLAHGRQRGAKGPKPDGWVLRTTSASPEPASPDPELSLCGTFDGALGRAAERIAERSARGLGDYATEE